ncbi:hypothetical protein TNCV_3545291 [Trichonephila clavipes]|uniref:Uncharacterized protein n=1 Tax=Trichonephila clavipes TaxID=2585209 RepID=A0A8X6RGY4_TRICX|nr:hypothetical protein TNCV_3545291 [Trichonephila clavipes]
MAIAGNNVGRMRIWKKRNESTLTCVNESTSTNLQAGGDNSMVLGMFSWYCMGPLIRVEERLNNSVILDNAALH